MSRTPRVPAAEAVEIGSLLTSPSGDQFVVVRKNGGHYSTAELADVQDFMDSGEMFEERNARSGWLDGEYPQTLAGTAPADVVAAIRATAEQEAAIRGIMADVSPADHRTIYNALTSVNQCRAWIASHPGDDAARFRDLRRRDVDKLTSIVGSLSSVATLLGTDEESLRREIGA